MTEKKTRMTKIIASLNDSLYERDEIIPIVLLSALAEQNIFLYGPPGTAKSLISRRLAKAFKTDNYFEYLMQKFSTPEEVFGPISLTELKKDNYIRKTTDYLPAAEFAFLDEIWKSSPAILNTLLTVINEKLFRNGSKVEKVPLKVLISASNETPPKGQGLEALYDRFLTRLYVPPMVLRKNLESLLQSSGASADIDISDDLKIKDDELNLWKKDIEKITLSEETLSIIHDIRLKIEQENRKEDFEIYVSDRRWQRAATLLKAGAFFCDRATTNIVDAFLLSHCLWTTKDNREKVFEIVDSSVKSCGFETGFSLKSLDDEKHDLDTEINKELYYTNDVYKTLKLDGNSQYFKCIKEYEKSEGYNTEKSKVTFYILYNKMKTRDVFHPVDKNGNALDWIKCEFQNQGVCSLKVKNSQRHYSSQKEWVSMKDFTPEILFHKNDKKDGVNYRLLESLRNAIVLLKGEIEKIIENLEIKRDAFLEELETPFISDEKIKIAMAGVYQQLENVKLRYKDCERLESLVQ